MKELTMKVYKTDDGMIFDDKEKAEQHENMTDIRTRITQLESLLKEREIPPTDQRVKHLLPLGEYLDRGWSAQARERLRTEGHYRYFEVETTVHVDILAEYMMLRRQLRDMEEHTEGLSDPEITKESIMESFEGNFPTIVFINDRFKGPDRVYNVQIGSALEQLKMAGEYFDKNGYIIDYRRKG